MPGAWGGYHGFESNLRFLQSTTGALFLFIIHNVIIQRYPEVDYLTGDSLFFEYNPEVDMATGIGNCAVGESHVYTCTYICVANNF